MVKLIGDTLKEHRIKKGYTLSELEKVSGVSYVQISRYEKNKANPTSKVIKKLADALEIDTTMLMDKEKDIINDESIHKQFKELMSLLKKNEEEKDKFALSKIIEVMLFKARLKNKLTE